tara:strand:+ start:6223 stop:7494 length:1272 start_codon:yes stop_codon:yes gene_type:complete
MNQEYKHGKDSSTIPCQVQKIYATPLHLCISIRVPGRTLWLWLGRKKPEEYIALAELAVPAKYRIKDVAIEWLRSKIKGKWLSGLPEITNNTVELEMADKLESLRFGYIDGRLHFEEIVRTDDMVQITSSTGKVLHIEPDQNYNSSLEERQHDQTLQSPVDDLESWFQRHNKTLQKKVLSKKSKKQKNIEKDIVKLESYKQLYEVAKNVDALKSESKLEMANVTIKFKSGLSEYQKADLIYSKAKRFKAAIELQEKRLEQLKAHKKDTELNLEQIYNVDSLGWQLPKNRQSIETVTDTKSGLAHEEFQLPGKYKIAIGLSARANDHLRKTWASKDDLWVHIENETGAHLFCKSEAIPDQKTWELIGSILKDYSKSSLEDVHLVWTRVRYLKPVKGAAGLVRFSNEKRILVRYCPTWRKMLSLR